MLKEGLAEDGKGALVELHHAIPIPKHDVPLAEILEFKHRRRDELVLLRHQLESFVSEIEGAADKTLALQKRIAELDQACSNLLAVGKEWQFPVYLSDFKASFSLTTVGGRLDDLQNDLTFWPPDMLHCADILPSQTSGLN